MDANNILTANLLDIIFEGKNKDYGAYDLRKTYNRRIAISLIITTAIIAILLIGSVIANNYSPKDLNQIVVRGVVLQPPQPIEPPPPLPPPEATIAYLPPVISKDIDVVKPPPEIQDFLDVKIDVKTVEGTKETDFLAPPLDIIGTQVVAKPVVKKNLDSVFLSVEIDASFRGVPENGQSM